MSDEAQAETPPAASHAVDDAGFKAALKRHHDDAYALARDAWQQAERHRAEIEALKDRVPAEGSVILAGDDADAYTKYRDLGPIEDLAAKLAERDSLAESMAAHERRKTLEAAAQSFDYDPDVLEVLPGVAEIQFDFLDGLRLGKKAKLAHVKDADGKPIPLDKYAADHWPKLLPSLKSSSAPTAPRMTTVPVPPPADSTRSFPRRSLVR